MNQILKFINEARAAHARVTRIKIARGDVWGLSAELSEVTGKPIDKIQDDMLDGNLQMFGARIHVAHPA